MAPSQADLDAFARDFVGQHRNERCSPKHLADAAAQATRKFGVVCVAATYPLTDGGLSIAVYPLPQVGGTLL